MREKQELKIQQKNMCVNLIFFLLSAAITCFCEKKNCKTKKIYLLTNIVQIFLPAVMVTFLLIEEKKITNLIKLVLIELNKKNSYM